MNIVPIGLILTAMVQTFSIDGYAFGINVLLYAMSH